MLAFRKIAPAFGAQLDDVPEPVADDDHVLVEVEAVGICGSDIHMYEWTAGYEWLIPSLPVVMGHEFCGRVIAAGENVTIPGAGQRVVVMPAYPLACIQGKHLHRIGADEASWVEPNADRSIP